MFERFTRTEITTSGARIHLRHGGDALTRLAPLSTLSRTAGDVERGYRGQGPLSALQGGEGGTRRAATGG
jgi:hypothetical protein